MSALRGIYVRGNPFAPRAADRLGGVPGTLGTGDEPHSVHVETDMMARLREQVADYLARPARGRALAVVGPFGIGKTHLTREMAALIRDQDNPPPLWPIDGAILDLGELYQDRLMILRDDRNQQAAFEDLVSNYLSDVTAVELEREGEHGERGVEIAAGLRNRVYDPEKVARTLRLDIELINRDLRRHLGEIIEHRMFATALALLLDHEFNGIVWDWLSGAEPAQALIDRGIDKPIRGINFVLETLAVFAFLYGTGEKPYVLVIDALENVLNWPEHERTRFVDAFLRLVNVYISRGGLLIFCLPPEPLAQLPTSLHERTLQFWPTGLNDDQTTELISAYLAPYHAADAADETDAAGPEAPADGLAPFTSEAVREIRELFTGNPRWMLTACSHAWDIAGERSDPGQRIDVPIVHDAVRALFGRAPREHIMADIRSTLTDGQWRTETGATRFAGRAAGRAGRIDFWVHAGRNSMLAIMLCDSILTGADVDALEEDIAAARDDVAGTAEVLVVVNGLLSPRFRDRFGRIARTQPVVYDDRNFPAQDFRDRNFHDRLHAAVTELTRRLEAADQVDRTTALQARISRLSGQQTDILDHLRQLDSRLARLTAPAERAVRTPRAHAELPEPVRDLFDEAYAAVELLSDISPGLDQALGAGPSGAVPGGVRPRRIAFTAAQFQTIGVATTMRRLLEVFEHDIAGWLRGVPAGPEGAELTDEQRRQLFVMCRSFEITTEVMPLGELEAQEHIDAAAERLSTIERRDRALRRAGTEDLFNLLATRVRDAVLEAVTAGPAEEPGRQAEP
jgi:hypothetical protein